MIILWEQDHMIILCLLASRFKQNCMIILCQVGSSWEKHSQWARNEPRLTWGAAQIWLHIVFTCGLTIIEQSITKSRIELIKRYLRFLFSRIVATFELKIAVLFHFCVYKNFLKQSMTERPLKPPLNTKSWNHLYFMGL